MRIDESSNIIEYLQKNGIDKLYHFTDRANLLSIFKSGGLLSWWTCEQNKIKIQKPGGDATSRHLDQSMSLENFVRLSFCRVHPMLHNAKDDGRITNPIILEINIDVCRLPQTQFSDINAVTRTRMASVGEGMSFLKLVNLSIVNKDFFSLSEEEKREYQAEVLVKQRVPLEYFLNIDYLKEQLTDKEKEELMDYRKDNLVKPQIVRLEQTDITYEDQKTYVRWDINNCTSIVVNGERILPHLSGFSLEPGTTTCELVARNEIRYCDGAVISKEQRKSISIRQYPVPKLDISSDKKIIKKDKDNDVVITWHIENAKEASICVGDTTESLSKNKNGTKDLQLSQTTHIQIKAIGKDGKREFESDIIQILAKNEARINSFCSDKKYSITDVPFILSWGVQYAKKIYIKQGNGVILAKNLPAKGQGKYVLKGKTTLIICAEDDFDVKEERIELDVLPKPRIQFISIPMPDVQSSINMSISHTRPNPNVAFPSIITAETAMFRSNILPTKHITRKDLTLREAKLDKIIGESVGKCRSPKMKLISHLANLKTLVKKIFKTN